MNGNHIKGDAPMKAERIIKESFAVIGKEGSTMEGPDVVAKLWQDANVHFAQVQPLAKVDDQGQLAGIWGVMSDLSRRFQPWEDGFTKGLYLAGVECRDDAIPPEGWVRWQVPGYEYLRIACEGGDTFARGLICLAENGWQLAGAVHDFTCPQTGGNFMLFPIRKLAED